MAVKEESKNQLSAAESSAELLSTKPSAGLPLESSSTVHMQCMHANTKVAHGRYPPCARSPSALEMELRLRQNELQHSNRRTRSAGRRNVGIQTSRSLGWGRPHTTCLDAGIVSKRYGIRKHKLCYVLCYWMRSRQIKSTSYCALRWQPATHGGPHCSFLATSQQRCLKSAYEAPDP
eukprot:365459-Chlamydomonas_euryale.AAC.1